MLLPDNYKKCWCGKKLTKKTRFAIKLEAPANINTIKRDKENKPYLFKTVVSYCCENCYQNLYKNSLKSIKANWWIYYPDTNPC